MAVALSAFGLAVTGLERFEYQSTFVRIYHDHLNPQLTLSLGSAGGRRKLGNEMVIIPNRIMQTMAS